MSLNIPERSRAGNLDRLLSVVYDVWAHRLFVRKGQQTYCNMAVQHVASVLGYAGFNGLTANEMFRVCLRGWPWDACTPSQAWGYALAGFFVVGASAGRPSGHIVTIIPGGGEFSTKWRAFAPACLDIGAQYTIGRGTNWAFKDQPLYFALVGG